MKSFLPSLSSTGLRLCCCATMAQAGELTMNPPSTMVDHPTQLKKEVERSMGKRGRDSGFDDLAPTDAEGSRSPKRLKGQDVMFRIVVHSRQVGKVIGRVGSRIQKIREETRATIKIADAIARHEERVIMINSKDNDEVITDAENALHQIASLILKEDDANVEALRVVGGGQVDANTLRLLIAGSQAGCLIGTSGQNLDKVRNASGASITILAQNQLPLCACVHESDHVVQISGDVPAVLKAVVEIGCQLRENPAREIISISPTYNLSVSRAAQPYVDPASADYVTFEMVISEAMVGGLIGRCGSNISRIRTESGATIKVHGGKGEQKLRQIHFGGSAPQVALAKLRVDEYIYSQMIQQVGPQQAVDYQAGAQAAIASMFPSSTAPSFPVHPSLPVHAAPPTGYYECWPYC